MHNHGTVVNIKWAGLALASLFVVLAGCAPSENTGTDSTTNTKTDNPSNPPADNKMAAVNFEADVKPSLATFCTPCHTGPTPKANMDVTKLTEADKATFTKMAKELEEGKMPPPKAKQPTPEEKTKLLEQLKSLAG